MIKYELLVEEDLNVGAGTVDVTSPGGGTQTGHQIRPRSIQQFSVHRFGAVGDGVTNDTVAVQNAIAAAVLAGAGDVYFPAGTYKVTGEIDINASYIRFIGEGRKRSIIQFDDTADRGFVVDTPTNDPLTSLFQADCAVGDRVINIVSTSGWTVGSWIFLDDSEANNGTLLTRIVSIAVQGGGNSLVTLEDAMPCVLQVANSATASVLINHPLLEGIEFHDLQVKCVTATPANKQTLLLLSRCNSFRVENCHFDGSTGPTVTTRETYRGHFTNTIFQHAITVAGSGLENQTATGLTITGCDVTMCQFGITFASAPYCRVVGCRVNGRQTNVALGRGIRFGESSNFGVVSGTNISDTNLYGIYSQDSAFCTFTGNTIAFCGDPVSNQGEHGIQLGGFEAAFCHHCTVANNVIRGCSGYGVAIAPTTTAGVDIYAVISGNNISLCLQGAISLFRVRKCTITGNHLAADGAGVVDGIIDLRSTDCGYCTIVGNVITNLGTTSCVAIFTNNLNGDYGHNIISANLLDQAIGPLTLNLTPSPRADTFGQPQAIPLTTVTPAHSTDIETDASLNEIVFWSDTINAGTVFNAANQTQGFEFDAHFLITGSNTKAIRFYVGSTSITFTFTNGTCDCHLHVVGSMKPQSNPGFSYSAFIVLGPDGSHASGYVNTNHQATSGAGADPIANNITFQLTAQNVDSAVAGQVGLTDLKWNPQGVPSGAWVQP